MRLFQPITNQMRGSQRHHQPVFGGEKWVTLSGGQKTRVALARACYRQADVYLLDGILSAVDSETGSWLFERCIKVLSARKALVVLAIHAVHILEQAEAIWVLKRGVVTEQGTFDGLRAREHGHLNKILSLMAPEKEELAVKSVVSVAKGIGINKSCPLEGGQI